MAAFFWSLGPASGGEQIMMLTIVGEVGSLQVTSSTGQQIPVKDFQPCIQTSQTLAIGPVPLLFLPLTANGTGCVAPGQTAPILPQETSSSPTDPGTTSPNPFCDALTKDNTVFTTAGSGGSVTSPKTPKELCDAAQMSPALMAARSSFESACGMLRADQANVTAYTAVAAAAATVCAGFIAAAATTPWPVNLGLALVAVVFGIIALIFVLLAATAAIAVGSDESVLDMAQQAWESAVAAVKTACCPAWITINTSDLVCP
jgi:hypothetical protein